MGEVVMVSSEAELEGKTVTETDSPYKNQSNNQHEEEETEDSGARKEGNSNGLLKWERFLPKMALRVLLVEADYSTRQLITALLRKCSYTVFAVSDGLKAWEILKGRPHNVDLILTEAELPSISGYALLTLIMEHEICKNIPVIIMSKEDSISSVYKCMLRGAADYLVKPVRRNELSNLWQHVWRRQSSLVGGNVFQDESVGQDKAEATSENNAASNHSIGGMAGVKRSKEHIEKGSDAQSSCTKPDVEAESAQIENMQELLKPAWGKFLPNGLMTQKHEIQANFGQKFPTCESEVGGSNAYNVSRTNVYEDVEQACEDCGTNDVTVNSSREAIDFIGASSNYNCSNNVKNSFESSPHLDLSLRGSHGSGSEIQNTEERYTLQQSHASAFTRYTNRPIQAMQSTVASVCNQKEPGANSEKKLSCSGSGYTSETLNPASSTQRSVISLAQNKEPDITTSCAERRVFPIPVEAIRFNKLHTSYGAVFSPIFCKQSSTSPIPSPSSANQPEMNFKGNVFQSSNYESNSEQLYEQLGQNANDPNNQTPKMQGHQSAKLDSFEDRGLFSPTTDQSASSSFCNGVVSRLNSMGYGSTSGSNSNVDQAAVVRAAAEGKTEEGIFTHNTNSHRSVHREAALNKFRLKRKERCYEKKVRYESRKKLAEQRPRVKGQFVRQVHVDALNAETE